VRAVVLTWGDPNAVTGGSLYHRRIAERAPRFGVDVEVRPLRGGGDRGAVAADADVIVVDSIVAARVRPERFDAPVVASAHQRPGGLVGPVAARLARAALDIRCYRRAAAVIAPSAFLARALERSGVPPARIRVVEPGSDLGLAVTTEAGRSAAVAFVAVGNLSPHKRPLELLDAFASLGGLDATLTLVGGPADRAVAARVEARLLRRDLAGRARWLGPWTPAGIGSTLGSSDVIVSPALHESYGMAVTEALRAGLPAIVSRSGNLPVLVRDGVDGFVIDARDTGALAAAMRRLATDDGLRAAFANAARRDGTRFPTWDTATERFVAVLEDVQAGLAPGVRRSAA